MDQLQVRIRMWYSLNGPSGSVERVLRTLEYETNLWRVWDPSQYRYLTMDWGFTP